MLRLLVIWLLLAFAASVQAEEAPSPAGYVIAIDLHGIDREKGTAIVRGGEELRPKLWMPLFAGDVVFVRDAASRLTLDMAQGGRVEVGAALIRFEAEGEIDTGDDAWSIIGKIGGILAGGGDGVVPTNLVSKGDGRLLAYGADKGPNFVLRDGPPLLVVWRGGEAPYRVATDIAGKIRPVGETKDRRFAVDVAQDVGRRLDVVVTDATGETRRIPFQLRAGLPEVPASLAAAGPSAEFDAVLLAGWLADRRDGAWRLEALRRLNALSGTSQAAARLLEALTADPADGDAAKP